MITKFQPTPSSRRVTLEPCPLTWPEKISTNTLLAEGDPWTRPLPAGRRISTNTLLAEGDHDGCPISNLQLQFQPTPSSRRVTRWDCLFYFCATISTNTLLAEGDAFSAMLMTSLTVFQPTPSSRRVTKAKLLAPFR